MENYDGLKQFFLVDTLLKAGRQSTSGSNSQRSADMDNPFREYASSTSLLSYLRTSFIDRPYMKTLLCCHVWHLITLGAKQTVEGFNSTQIKSTWLLESMTFFHVKFFHCLAVGKATRHRDSRWNISNGNSSSSSSSRLEWTRYSYNSCYHSQQWLWKCWCRLSGADAN